MKNLFFVVTALLLSGHLFGQNFSLDDIFTKLKFKDFSANNVFLEKSGWTYIKSENAGTPEEQNIWEYYKDDKLVAKLLIYKSTESIGYNFVSSNQGFDMLLHLLKNGKPYFTSCK